MGTDQPPGKVSLGKTIIIEAQQGELNRIFNEFDEVITKKLSQTSATSESLPVQSYPYKIAPAWKEEHHGEIKQLIDQGILEPSHSPCSAPVVPIRKTNGSLWLCIDCSKLNHVTIGDPYKMPRVDDLLDKVAGATLL